MESNGDIRHNTTTIKYMGWAAVTFYSKPSAFGIFGSDRDRYHESWKCRDFLDCVICHFTVSKENQTRGNFVPAGAAWFSVCDKFPVEKLCGSGSPLRSCAGIAVPDPGTERLVLSVRPCIRILCISGGDLQKLSPRNRGAGIDSCVCDIVIAIVCWGALSE